MPRTATMIGHAAPTAVTILIAVGHQLSSASTTSRGDPAAGRRRRNRRGRAERRSTRCVGRMCRAPAPVSPRLARSRRTPMRPRCRPTSAIRASPSGDDPGACGALFPVRPLSADQLVASGHAARQPAGHLERQLTPPWGSKYTININTEMNYWPAEPTNLAECIEPLLRMVDEICRHRRADGAEHVRRARLGGASQHRPLARDGADRRRRMGHVADRRRVAVHAPVGPLRVQRRPSISRAASTR